MSEAERFGQLRALEALLFAASEPLSLRQLGDHLPEVADMAGLLEELAGLYANRGVVLQRVGKAYAFRTAPDLAYLFARKERVERKLSRAAVESLAVIAYHQPVTRAEIEEIRQVGVSRGTIDLLMELEWIKLGRRRQTPGRPVTFVTTEKFMEHFGLESIKDLPGLDELRQSGLLEARPSPGLPFGAGEDDDPDAYADDDEDDDDRDRQQDLMM